MDAPVWRLRPATVEADTQFLKLLFARTDIMLQALPPELRVELLDMQYRGRDMTYSAQSPERMDSLICLKDGRPIGRCLIAQGSDAIRIMDVAILPEWQGRGIGAAVLEDYKRESCRAGLTLALRVTKENPALRLYRRLGFEAVSEDEMAYEMVWAPGVRQ